MAAAAVQTANNGSGGTTVVVTVSSTAANSLLVVSIWGGYAVTSVTDNQSSSYTIIGPVSTGGGGSMLLSQAYAICAAGVTSVTITQGTASNKGACVDEYSGIDTGDPYDVHATNSGTGTSLSVSLTPAAAGKLIVASLGGYAATTSAWTAGSGYTLYGTNTLSGLYELLRSQYRLSGTTSETAPATVSYAFEEGWAEIATSFNVAAIGKSFGVINGV